VNARICRISRTNSSMSDRGWIEVGLEMMPLASVTLSDGRGPEERAPTRLMLGRWVRVRALSSRTERGVLRAEPIAQQRR
jgi:hypothetical protein